FKLSVVVEQRALDCWILTSNDKKLEVFKNATRDTTRFNFTPKWDLQTMASFLDARLDIPVVNGSSFADEILLDLPEDPSDLSQLHTVLNSAGISLKKVKKVFPVLVVTELK